jgi:hypothetical protein
MGLVIIVVVGLIGLIFWWNRWTSIKASDVDKMTIDNFVGDVSFTTTDRGIIENIVNQINNLTHKRDKFGYLASPHIVIYAYSESGDKIYVLYLYGFRNNNGYYCYSEKNGRSSWKYLIDGEELFNLAKSYITE